MSLRSIVQTLGGALYDGGRRANIPAPGHSAADRSVSLLLKEGRVLVHTFGDGDWRSVLDHLRRLGLIDAANAPVSLSGAMERAKRVEPAARRPNAVLWRCASGRRAGRSGARSRSGIAGCGGSSATCRGPRPCATAPRRRSPPTGARATVAPPSWPASRRRTAASPPSRSPIWRRTAVAPKTCAWCARPSGQRRAAAQCGSIRSPTAMLVGEGVFTTLSASEWFGLPAWALMSTRNLRAWSPPAGRALGADRRGPRQGRRSLRRAACARGSSAKASP